MELKQRAYLLIMLSVIWASLQPIFLSYARGAGMNTFFLLVYATSIVANRCRYKKFKT